MLVAKHFLAQFMTEETGSGNTGTAITHGIEQPVLLPQVRRMIERIGDQAGPDMADTDLFQLGKHFCKETVHIRCVLVGLVIRPGGTPAKQDSLAIR